jgi:hypothetical protein
VRNLPSAVMGYPSGRNLRKSDRKSKENQDNNKMILKDFEKIFLDFSPQAIPPSRSAASGRTLKDNS